MKKMTLLSLVAIAVLFTACDEKTKNSAKEMASSATKTVQDAATNAVEATKETAKKATQTVAKATESVKEATTKAVESTKETATKVTEAAKEAVSTENELGKKTYAKCVVCHGKTGTTKALGKSAVIAGQPATDLEAKIRAYKAGTRSVAGMGKLMTGQVASMNDETIKAIAKYISEL